MEWTGQELAREIDREREKERARDRWSQIGK